MLRPLAASLAASLLLAPRLAAQSAGELGRYDNQWRPEVVLTIPAAPGLDASLGGQLQVGERAGGLTQSRLAAGLQLAASRWISLAAGYQHFRVRTAGGGTIVEHRPTVAGTFRAPVARGFGLQDRNLVEFRDRGGSHSVRYRNRLTLERRSRLAGRDLRLYLSEEPYYDSRYDAWVRNQVALGGVTPVARHLSAELYLMRQDDGRSKPGDLVIVGTVLRVR